MATNVTKYLSHIHLCLMLKDGKYVQRFVLECCIGNGSLHELPVSFFRTPGRSP